MTDTGQVPGEGQPENAGGRLGHPHPADVHSPPADAGYTEQPQPGAAPYPYLEPHETGGEEDDLLLMPGAQGAWSEQQAQYQQPSAGTPPHGTYAGGVPDPAAAEYAGAQPAAAPEAQPQPLQQPLSQPQPLHQSQPQPARRPLHMGPPLPDASNGVVRSLADRGPAAARHAGTAPHVEPPVVEPEAEAEPQAVLAEPGPEPEPVSQPEPQPQPEYVVEPDQPAGGEFVVGAQGTDYATAPEYAAGPQYFAAPPEDAAPLPGPQLADIPQPGEAWDSAPPQAQPAPQVQPEPVREPETEPVPEAETEPVPEAEAEAEPMHAETVGREEAAAAPEDTGVSEPVQDADVPSAPLPAEHTGPSEPVEPESAETPPAAATIPAQGGEPVMEPAHVPAPHAAAAQGADATMAEEPVIGIPAQVQPALAPEQLDARSASYPGPVPEIPAQLAHEAVTTPADPALAEEDAPQAEDAPVAEAALPAEQPPAVEEAMTSEEETPWPAEEQGAHAAEPVAVDPGHSIVTDDQSRPAEAEVVAGIPVPEADAAAEAPAEEQVELPGAEAVEEEPPQQDAVPEELAGVETSEAGPAVMEAAEPVEPVEVVEAVEAAGEETPEPVVQEPAAEETPEAPATEAAEAPEAETVEAVTPEAVAAEAEEASEAEDMSEAGEPAPAVAPDAVAEDTAPAGTAPEGADAEATEEPEPEPEAEPEPELEREPEPEPEPLGPPAEGYAEAERAAVHRVMRERRDIRNGFRSDPIPHEVLLRVLEAAHTAPSVGHSQPWDFVVIRSEETRRTMHELATRQREAYAKSLPKGRAKQFKELKIEAILETPVNIVVTADPTRGGRHTLGRHTQPQMAPYSSALAVENLWLAARAEGLGVGWVSFFDEREMVRSLGLPEHLEAVAYLCVGYVDEFPEEPELMRAGWSKRRPLSWVVHEETYGRRALPGEDPHNLLQETLQGIRPLDAKALGEAWERQKRMTKPSGALGMLEIISAQLSGLSRQCPPPIPEPAAVAIFAGDHGVHAQGVTAWPQEVTAQMVANFLGGGAVCNAFASQVGAEVCVVDVGVASDLPSTPGLLPRKVRAGTGDFTTGPALSREDVLRALEVGIETARDLVAAGNKALLTGEMGIANTTVSAALVSVYTGVDPSEVTGRGTGINDEMHARKIDVVRRGLELHQPDPADPIGVLAAFGGLEHAAMAGLLLGGASLRTPVILDGVSAGAAALVARAIAPEVLAACIAGHRSAEPGHVAALNKLGLRPLVDLDLRLGEGTGALLALPVVQSAARAMHEVATFDSAGVTEKN